MGLLDRMRTLSFVIFLILINGISHAQNQLHQQKIDSLRFSLMSDSTKIYHFQTIRPALAIDNRNSFIRKNPVNLNGIQFGVVYKEEYQFGIGFYGLSATSKEKAVSKTIDNHETINQKLKMNYVTFYYQHVLVDKKHFELDLPLEIGLGKFTVERNDSASGAKLPSIKSGIVPIGIGLMPIYKPWKWIGISYLLGYRHATASHISFSGAYYSFGLWLDLRQIIRDTRYYGIKKRKYHKAVRKLTV
jgi:hypothetical protein